VDASGHDLWASLETAKSQFRNGQDGVVSFGCESRAAMKLFRLLALVGLLSTVLVGWRKGKGREGKASTHTAEITSARMPTNVNKRILRPRANRLSICTQASP